MTTTSSRRTEHRLEAVEGFLLLGMEAQALRDVDAIRAGGDNSVRVCLLRAEALRGLRRHEEALAEFETANARDHDDLSTLMGMAWCLKRLNRLSDALDIMQRAYQVFPEEPVVLYNIACYHSLSGDKPQALSWLGRALRMEPKLRQLIPDETDFDPLRNDPDFQFIISDPQSDDAAS